MSIFDLTDEEVAALARDAGLQPTMAWAIHRASLRIVAKRLRDDATLDAIWAAIAPVHMGSATDMLRALANLLDAEGNGR